MSTDRPHVAGCMDAADDHDRCALRGTNDNPGIKYVDREPARLDPLANDERLPDMPGNGTHIHSLDRCEHYIAGEEVGWLCGMFPMFTNIATARASSDTQPDRSTRA